MRKRNAVAWGCIAGPWVLIVLTLMIYAITSMIVGASVSDVVDASSAPSVQSTIGRIINVVLGFLGILGVIGIPVGAAVGIYLLSTKQTPEQPRSPQV